jgi:hypothetical protein
MSGTRGGAYYSAGLGLQDLSMIADGGGHSWALHVCAHPGDQDTATPMRACLNIVDDATQDGDGVGLAPAVGGQLAYIFNYTGHAISVYAAAGSTDSIVATDRSTSPVMTLPASTAAMFVSIPGQWAITTPPPAPDVGDVPEAPVDGPAYVRSMSSWLNADTRYTTPAQAAAAAPVQSVATRIGDITLTHSDLTDWTSATSGFYLTSNPASYINIGQARAGVADGSAAAAGQIGELLTAQRLSTAGIALPNTTVDTVVATLALTAGDWDVWGSLGLTLTSNTNTTMRGWLNAGGTTMPSIDQLGGNAVTTISSNTPQIIMHVTHMRVSLAAAGSVVLGATNTSQSGTVTGWGKILARRVR